MTNQKIMRHSLRDPLGEDILNLVLGLLSQSELNALSLVSKDSRAITEPFLYEKIEWTWEDDRQHPITPFLRTILYRPELAAYVKSLALVGNLSICKVPGRSSGVWRGLWYDDRLPKISVLGLDQERAIQFINGTKVPYIHQWEDELLRGIMDALVALLLSQLHNLRNLFLGHNIAKHSRLIGMLLTSALCEKVSHGLPTFQHLKTVDIKLEMYNSLTLCGKETANVLPYFYLPELESLSVALDNPITLTWPMNTPPNPSTITSLNLSYIRETNLSSLLSVTPQLKILEWNFYYCTKSQHVSNTPLVDLNKLGTALSLARDTLEELKISAYCDPGSNLDAPLLDLQGSLTSLIHFPRLEILEIPLQFLVGSFEPDAAAPFKDVVPRNLHSLILTDDLQDQYELNEWDDESLMKHFRSWLEDSSCAGFGLRRLTLMLIQTDECWGPRMRRVLVGLGEEWGVEVEIVKVLPDLKGS